MIGWIPWRPWINGRRMDNEWMGERIDDGRKMNGWMMVEGWMMIDG